MKAQDLTRFYGVLTNTDVTVYLITEDGEVIHTLFTWGDDENPYVDKLIHYVAGAIYDNRELDVSIIDELVTKLLKFNDKNGVITIKAVIKYFKS